MCTIEQFLRLLLGIIDEVGLVNAVMVNGGASAIRPSRPIHFTVLSMSLPGRTHPGSVFFRAHPLSGNWLTTEAYGRLYVGELEHAMSVSSCILLAIISVSSCPAQVALCHASIVI
jgi:hypothetical protein